MSEQPGTDICAADLDVEGNEERPETAEPEAYEVDSTLGGLGGAEDTSGGAG